MLAGKEGGATQGEEAPGAAVLEDIMCFTDYDVVSFHTNQSPSHRLSLTSEASIAAVSHQLLHQVCLLATLHTNYQSLDYFVTLLFVEGATIRRYTPGSPVPSNSDSASGDPGCFWRLM